MTDPVPALASVPAPPQSDDRRRVIAEAEIQSRQFVPFRGGYREARVVAVSNACLLYRAANGRIVAELRQRAATTGRDPAELIEREADREVQAILHELLVAKAGDPAGPVLQELARHAQQTEPLLITVEGVVVNGNRRLAAMRELIARDPERYASFAEVRAAVLPEDADAADIEFIEASLQMAPDVKLAYGWINRRMKLFHQRRVLGLSPDAIADAYRMEDPAQVEVELEELALADAYLAFKGRPGDYELVGEAEALFRGLRAHIAELKEPLRDLWRLAGFVLIDGREAIAGPMDRYFPFAAPAPGVLPAWTMRRLAEERDIVPMVNDAPAGTRFPALAKEETAALRALFERPEGTEETAASLYGLMEQLRSEHQEIRAPATALKQLTRARTTLAGLELGRMTPKQLRELKSEMAALQASVAALLGEAREAPAAASDDSRRGGLFGGLFGRA